MYRTLYCFVCEAWTCHKKSGNDYICDCGAWLTYHVNNAKPMCAMDLRETPDARERFSDWIAGQ